MAIKYNEAFAHVCTAAYFAKESLKWELPEDVKKRILSLITELETIKADLEVRQ